MRAIMLNALDLGMLNGDFAFLTVNLLPSATVGNNTFMGNDGRDAEAALAFRGILSIHVREPTTPLWQSFKERVRAKMNASPFYIKLDDSEQVIKLVEGTLHYLSRGGGRFGEFFLGGGGPYGFQGELRGGSVIPNKVLRGDYSDE